jgi:hypothetical protein
MTQLDAIVRAHRDWLHPSRSFIGGGYRGGEEHLRYHIAYRRAKWTPAEIDAEAALWGRRQVRPVVEQPEPDVPDDWEEHRPDDNP